MGAREFEKWFKVPTLIGSSPEFAGLSDSALCAWVVAMGWSKHHETDGVIDWRACRMVFARWPNWEDLVDELADAGHVSVTRDRLVIHAFVTLQETAADAKRRREKAAARQRKSRATRTNPNVTRDSDRDETRDSQRSHANRVRIRDNYLQSSECSRESLAWNAEFEALALQIMGPASEISASEWLNAAWQLSTAATAEEFWAELSAPRRVNWAEQ